MKTLGYALALLVGTFALTAYAGSKNDYGWPAAIYRYADGSIQVSGTLGNVRASSDTQSYIGCSLYTYTMSDGSFRTNAWCFAVSATGEYVSCSTQDPKFVQTAGAMSGDAHLTFYTNATGACTSLNVQHVSSNRPKTL